MSAWAWIMVCLGALWLIGTPTSVLLWERRETRLEEAAEAEEIAEENDFVQWALEFDDTVELP